MENNFTFITIKNSVGILIELKSAPINDYLTRLQDYINRSFFQNLISPNNIATVLISQIQNHKDTALVKWMTENLLSFYIIRFRY